MGGYEKLPRPGKAPSEPEQAKQPQGAAGYDDFEEEDDATVRARARRQVRAWEKRSADAAATTAADAATIAVENKGSGQAVDPGLAAAVGAQIGADVSGARVHGDPLSREATGAMQARAFAHGNDVFLGPGEQATDTGLMAHELTHVAQQQGGAAAPQRKVEVGDANAPAEQHADRVASQVATGAAPARLLVDFDRGTPAAGQLSIDQFLALLHAQITGAVEQELGALAADCPYIEHYFAKYGGQPAGVTESLIRRWIPPAANVRGATALIPLILDRVRAGVRTWQTSGQLPPDLVAADPALAAAPPAAPKAQRQSLDSLEAELGAGQPVDSATAQRMSSALGADISDARIHTGPAAAAKAAEHDATAFAVGQNVVMGAGAPGPGSLLGDALLAHELAHVAQQKDAAADPRARKKPIGEEDEAAERDAGLGRMTNFGSALGDVMRTGLQLQRCSGGVDPNYQAAKVIGPDVGRKIGSKGSSAPGSYFPYQQFTAGETVGVTASESQALALAKTLGTDLAIIPSSGQFFIYRVAGAHDLDLELRYGEKAGIVIDPGVHALINDKGVVYRADDLARGASRARASDGASADPFQAYQELNQGQGGIEGLPEAELVATFQAAMYDTALSVLAASEVEARQKKAQFETPGATGSEEHSEIDGTAREVLALQTRIDKIEADLVSLSRNGNPYQAVDPLHDIKMDLAREKQELQQQKKPKYRRYPMLARYQSAEELSAFVAKSGVDREKALAGDAGGVLSDIFSTRRNIQSGDLNLWTVPSIVDATTAGLGLAKDSPQRARIQSKAAAQERKEKVLNIALAVFSIGFGIAGAVFSGGASLAFTAGALGLGAYDAIKTTEDHFIKNSATNTDPDAESGLLTPEQRQHWGWLVMAWAGVALDFADVLRATQIAAEVAKVARGGKTGKTITEAAETLAAGDQKLLERLRRAAGDANLTDTITEATRPALSSRVGAEITIDGNLGSEVRVLYGVDDRGRSFVTGIKAGTAAKVGDILAHADTVKALDQYTGLIGRVRELWDRIRSFAGKGKSLNDNPFEAGSKAFESWAELKKLDGLISYRRGQLTELLEKSPAATDAQAALKKEISFLENEVNRHQRVVDGLVTERGAGFVAMSDGTQEALKGKHRLPDFPTKTADDITGDELKASAYYFERQTDGEFALRKKLDKSGGVAQAPKELAADEVAALATTHGEGLVRWANDTLPHNEIKALFGKADKETLNALRGVTAADAKKLIETLAVELAPPDIRRVVEGFGPEHVGHLLSVPKVPPKRILKLLTKPGPTEASRISKQASDLKMRGVVGDLSKAERDALYGDIGAQGELDAMTRWLDEGKPVEALDEIENAGVTNPDFLVGGAMTELKTVAKSPVKDTFNNLLRKANTQFKDSMTGAQDPGLAKGVLEIQFVNQKVPVRFADVQSELLREYRPKQFTSVTDVKIYVDKKLLGHWQRSPAGEIVNIAKGEGFDG